MGTCAANRKVNTSTVASRNQPHQLYPSRQTPEERSDHLVRHPSTNPFRFNPGTGHFGPFDPHPSETTLTTVPIRPPAPPCASASSATASAESSRSEEHTSELQSLRHLVCR